ncbi:MAG: tRNA (adenosine(37)-N6)-threonylcarbamoyltransferase complex dimerization subunit type 1 TsaB [Phormidesmis sp.]
MLGLAIHTSSPQLGLMLQGTDEMGKAISRYQVWDLGRDVSSHLHVKLMEFMGGTRWQELSFVAVAKGPGGFTGTRVGVVMARTLAQQLQVPLLGVSSLAAIGITQVSASLHARQRSIEHTTEPTTSKDVAIAMMAKREAVFGAIYRSANDGDFTAVRLDEAMPIDRWAAVLAQWNQPFVEVTISANEGVAKSVQGVMEIAIARYQKGDRPDWSTVMPFYGQHPVHR